MVDITLKELQKYKDPKYYYIKRRDFWQFYCDTYGIPLPNNTPKEDSYTIERSVINVTENEEEIFSDKYVFISFLKLEVKEQFERFNQEVNRELFQLENEKVKKSFLIGLNSQLKGIIKEIQQEKDIIYKYKVAVLATFKHLIDEFYKYHNLEKIGLNLHNIVQVNIGFDYKFKHTHPENLKDLFQSLNSHTLIDQETSAYKDFERIFISKPILKRILWTGSNSEFYYFIRKIFNHKSFNISKGNIWNISTNCFIVIDRNGKEYPSTSMKSWKNPSIKKQDLINRILHI